jgi:hypothetical protein
MQDVGFFFFSLAVMVTLPGNKYWMTVPGTRCQYENGTVLMSVIICLNASIYKKDYLIFGICLNRVHGGIYMCVCVCV